MPESVAWINFRTSNTSAYIDRALLLPSALLHCLADNIKAVGESLVEESAGFVP